MSEGLRRLVVLYETEDACRRRLEREGRPEEVAAEVAFYLRQATDFRSLIEPVAVSLLDVGVELCTASIDERHRWLPWVTEPCAGTMIWCLTDGFAWYRGSLVSSMAGLLDVPQFGSPPAAQHFCQDKFRCLAVARAAGFATPPTVLVENDEFLSPASVLPSEGDLFVKPNRLGAKLGIGPQSRVATLDAAVNLCRGIWNRYGDRALIQPYLPGQDVRVSFMDLHGEDGPLGLYTVLTHERGFPTLDDSRRITTPTGGGHGGPELANLACTPAGRQIALLARKLARLVDLRDYWSLDIRLADDGQPFFLELEVCPAVTIYDFLTYLRDSYGADLPEAIKRATAVAYARRSVVTWPRVQRGPAEDQGAGRTWGG